uniref:AP-1 complex subunit sigma-3 isoform X2 n=1 Tax=Callithrix jacchus TaxID=9483 RepID=UPI0023DD1D2A|nr:AP-1 complex subunit sigma-3 isoform X2 [Callithrix jacchus]
MQDALARQNRERSPEFSTQGVSSGPLALACPPAPAAGWRGAEERAQVHSPQIHFILLFSRQGKLRLQKWYVTLPDKERKKITREIVQIILSRGHRTSSFIDWKELKLVYKRYASLYFCCAVDNQDNELLTLEIVHRYVELLDKYFGNAPVYLGFPVYALNSEVPQLATVTPDFCFF